MTTQTLAANRLYRAVRRFATTTKEWETAVRYFTLPDETWDVTLVSQRVYGNRNETVAIMAAAGLDTVEQALTPRWLVLPTAAALLSMKRAAGVS